MINAGFIKEGRGRQNFAGVHGTDGCINIIFGNQLSSYFGSFFGRTLRIIDDQFNLLSVETAVRVDVINGELYAVATFNTIGGVTSGDTEIGAEFKCFFLRKGQGGGENHQRNQDYSENLFHFSLSSFLSFWLVEPMEHLVATRQALQYCKQFDISQIHVFLLNAAI